MSFVYYTDERRDYLNFTPPLITLSNVIFGHKDGMIYGNMDGLVGGSIAQTKGSTVHKRIKTDYPELRIVEVDNALDGLLLVASKEVDAFIGNVPVASNIISSEKLKNIIVVGETPYTFEAGIGIRNDLPELSSIMSKAVNSVSPLERAQISRKWLSIEQGNSIYYELIMKILGIMFVIVGAILFWAVSLRREVARRRTIEEELLKSQKDAEEANLAKSTFLANMSHEIRTPLNAILGFSKIMTSEMFGEIKEPKYKEYLNDIKFSGDHLATVINDILDISKIDAGKWHIEEEEFSLEECLNEAIEKYFDKAKIKNIAISKDNTAFKKAYYIHGDRTSIQRTINNLISNAIKFTDHGGAVKCILSDDDQGIYIAIEDNGNGIHVDRIEQVLNPFEQAGEHFDLNEEGTGLGLTIVKKLTELQGGTFSLISEFGIGTKAVISFPPQAKLFQRHKLLYQTSISSDNDLG